MDFKKMRQDPKAKNAGDLKDGDIVHSSFGYMAVVGRPIRGIKTPTGKVEITFKYLDGRYADQTTGKVWGKSTPIRVEGNMNDTVENPNNPQVDNVQAMDANQLLAIIDNGKDTPLTLEDCIHILNIEPTNYMHKDRLAALTGWFQMNVTTTVDDLMKAHNVQTTQLGILRKAAKKILDK